MGTDALRKFLLTTVKLTAIGFVLGVLVTPPEPFTQLLFVAAVLPVVLVCSYLLTYRIDLEWP